MNKTKITIFLLFLVSIFIFNVALAESDFKMNVKSNSNNYSEGDQIVYYIQGIDSNKNYLTVDQGYNVQVYIKINSNKQTSGVGFNGEYDHDKNAWVVKIIAPEAGKYKVDFSLYCSLSNADCDRESKDSQQQNISKSLKVNKQPKRPKKPMTFSLKDNYVTYDLASDGNPVITETSDGTLFVHYNSASLDQAGVYYVYSKDGGNTWTKPKYFSDSWSDIDSEANEKSFLLFQQYHNNEGAGLEILDDKKRSYSIRYTLPNDSIGSLLKSKNGYYYISYSSGNPSKVFVSKTKKLNKWSTPKEISSGNKPSFDSSLTETNNGNLYLAYNNYSNKGVSIFNSTDGEKWNFEKTIITQTNAHSGINMISIANIPVVFWSDSYNTYYSYKKGKNWSEPKIVLSSTPFGIDAIVKSDNKVIAVYVVEQDGQRDIKIKNLDSLDISQ